jgi:hypothetical protein
MKLAKMNGPYGTKYELSLSKEEFEHALKNYLLLHAEEEIRQELLVGKSLSIQLDEHTLGTNHRVKIIIK